MEEPMKDLCITHVMTHPSLSHPHTGEPLRAVGFRANGTPIWPILGASPDDGGGEGDGSSGGGSGDGDSGERQPAGDKPLGPAGEKALGEERDARKAAEKRAKAAESELEKARTANLSEADKKIAEARKEAAAEATKAANSRLVNSEARAIAAELKFRDTRDVVVQLRDDLGSVEVDTDGEVDEKALRKLIADLAKTKPYLVDDGKTVTAPAKDAGIGASGNGDKADPGPGRNRIRAAIEATSKT
jgi:hypothetical protein